MGSSPKAISVSSYHSSSMSWSSRRKSLWYSSIVWRTSSAILTARICAKYSWLILFKRCFLADSTLARFASLLSSSLCTSWTLVDAVARGVLGQLEWPQGPAAHLRHRHRAWGIWPGRYNGFRLICNWNWTIIGKNLINGNTWGCRSRLSWISAWATGCFFFLPSPLGFRQVDPHAIFACSMFAVIVALEFIHLGEKMGKRPCWRRTSTQSTEPSPCRIKTTQTKPAKRNNSKPNQIKKAKQPKTKKHTTKTKPKTAARWKRPVSTIGIMALHHPKEWYGEKKAKEQGTSRWPPYRRYEKKQHSTVRKPRLPPARSPRSHRASHVGIINSHMSLGNWL